MGTRIVTQVKPFTTGRNIIKHVKDSNSVTALKKYCFE